MDRRARGTRKALFFSLLAASSRAFPFSLLPPLCALWLGAMGPTEKGREGEDKKRAWLWALAGPRAKNRNPKKKRKPLPKGTPTGAMEEKQGTQPKRKKGCDRDTRDEKRRSTTDRAEKPQAHFLSGARLFFVAFVLFFSKDSQPHR